MSDVQIIEANLNHVSHDGAIVDLLDGYARTPFGQGQSLAQAVRDRLIGQLKQHPTTIILLAESGDQFVGIAVCFFGFSTFAARPLLNIHDIYVREDHQGCGIGRQLLEAVERAARDQGCCKVTLEVMDANSKASDLYQRCGYELGVIGQDAHRFLSKKL